MTTQTSSEPPKGSQRKTTLGMGKSHPPPGARPGTLAVPEGASPPLIKAFQWDEEELEESTPESPRAAAGLRRAQRRTWIDVQGLGDIDLLLELGETFELHPLALEDAVNVPQRPACQEFESHLLVIARALRPGSVPGALVFEQISFFLGHDFLVTIQEHHGDQLEPVRNRLRQRGPRLRRGGHDYVTYALLDAVIDAYYKPVEEIGDLLEQLETEALERPTAALLARIQQLKKELLLLRRTLWPTREALNSLIRDDSTFVGESVRVYLRDCYDHTVQLLEIVEAYREHCAGLMSTYLSAVSNRTNDVMRVLTVMASIFIPLTFLAGIYGMNFAYMPELQWRFGYPALIVLMLVVGGGLFISFRRRGWWSEDPED